MSNPTPPSPALADVAFDAYQSGYLDSLIEHGNTLAPNDAERAGIASAAATEYVDERAWLAARPPEGDAGPSRSERCNKLVNDGRHVCRFFAGHDGPCYPHINAQSGPVSGAPGMDALRRIAALLDAGGDPGGTLWGVWEIATRALSAASEGAGDPPAFGAPGSEMGELPDGGPWFGCFTGDCPHGTQAECDTAIRAYVAELERDHERLLARASAPSPAPTPLDLGEGETWLTAKQEVARQVNGALVILCDPTSSERHEKAAAERVRAIVARLLAGSTPSGDDAGTPT